MPWLDHIQRSIKRAFFYVGQKRNDWFARVFLYPVQGVCLVLLSNGDKIRIPEQTVKEDNDVYDRVMLYNDVVWVTVVSPLMEDLWSIWSTKDPTKVKAEMQNMFTTRVST